MYKYHGRLFVLSTIFCTYSTKGGTIPHCPASPSLGLAFLFLFAYYHCFYTLNIMLWKKKPQADPDHSSQSHLSIPMQPVDTSKDEGAIEFEPLPTPVDFSGMKPTARYQTRALARRALSFHARQRLTNGMCLIVWPILMAILIYVLATIVAGEFNVAQGVFRMCANDANPLNSRRIVFNERDLTPEEIASGFNASYYPRFNRNFHKWYTENLPCVRWFGESHPNQPPYANGTGTGVDT